MVRRNRSLRRRFVLIASVSVAAAAALTAYTSGPSGTPARAATTTAAAGSTRPAAPVARPLSATTKAWWSYDRKADYQAVTAATKVAVRDGTQLDCTLVRPATGGAAAPGRFPGLVVEFTPYVALRSIYVGSEGTYFAEHGYNALVCNLRGTGGSGGTWQHAMSPQDGKDARDLVEWLAVQPYSNGRIGMTGESYGGDTSYAAAMNQPPHLVTIAPFQSPSDLYNDVIYPGGIKTTEGGSIDNWPDTAQIISGGAINAADEYAANRAHPTWDEYWRSRSFLGHYGAIKVPVFTMGGWVDQYFRSGELTNIEGAFDRTWAVYGQWPHMGPVRYPGCGPVCLSDGLAPGVALAWFDRWIMKLPDVPIPARPTFVSHSGAPAGTTTDWREITGYRPFAPAVRSLTLNPDGSLGDPAGAAGTATFHQPADPAAAGGSVTFQTTPLTAATSIFGHPALTLRATLSGSDANLYAELIDIGPDGKETLVNNGFLRASHRYSNVTPSPVPTGTPVTFVLPVRPDDWQFPAGHRIAVRISGGAASMLTQNPTPVDVTVATGRGGSVLTLPTITGS